MILLHLCWDRKTTLDCIQHLSFKYLKSFCTSSDVVHGHIHIPSHHHHHKYFPRFWRIVWTTGHRCLKSIPFNLWWGCKPLQTASYIYLIHIKHVWASSDVVNRHLGASLYQKPPQMLSQDCGELAKILGDWLVQMMPLHLCWGCI